MLIKVHVHHVSGVAAVHAGSKCSGNPPTYDGKPCASTTNYADGHKGACGCGPEGSDNQVAHFTVNVININKLKRTGFTVRS